MSQRADPPLVRVQWFDAWSDDEDRPADWRKDCLVTTVGWLIERGDVVRVAAESGPVSGYRSITHIPAVIVKKIERL